MKIKLILSLLSLSLLAAACGNTDKADNKGNTAEANKDKNTATAPKKDDKKEEEFTGEMKFPYDYPATKTTAKKGEHILVPSYNWLTDALKGKPGDVTMIWYNKKMEEPGDEMSKVNYGSETKEVPNAYIVPIPAGATAKKGDIVLTWWQTGSGLQRAIVTDAKDPKAPTVQYIDIGYDNPAKDSKSGKGIGQTDYQIKPDTFTPLTKEMAPGSSVSIGSDMKHGQVINVSGDKVFVSMFAGKTGVFPKSDVKGVPVKPSLKAGDKVKAVSIGSFSDAEVTKVDASIGRVWVKFGSSDKEEVVSIGDVIPN